MIRCPNHELFNKDTEKEGTFRNKRTGIIFTKYYCNHCGLYFYLRRFGGVKNVREEKAQNV